MDVSLTPDLEAFVRRKVETGSFNDAGEVIRSALRRMLAQDSGGVMAPGKADVITAIRALEPELRARGIVSAALFGSVARGEARPDSDVDVLIRVAPSATFDLIDLVAVGNLIGDQLGRTVHVVDRDALQTIMRDPAPFLADAETVF